MRATGKNVRALSSLSLETRANIQLSDLGRTFSRGTEFLFVSDTEEIHIIQCSLTSVCWIMMYHRRETRG